MRPIGKKSLIAQITPTPTHYHLPPTPHLTHTRRYPPSSHPVLAFKGAPASFPVLPEHRPLQRYVRWSKRMESEATSYINHTFGVDTPYIGVHLRMGVDWVRGGAWRDGGGVTVRYLELWVGNR